MILSISFFFIKKKTINFDTAAETSLGFRSTRVSAMRPDAERDYY